MNAAVEEVPRLRVLLRAATSRDAMMTAQVLEHANIASYRCADNHAVASELGRGAGALLITEEAFSEAGAEELIRSLTMQPPWSDLPVLVLARQGANSRAVVDAMNLQANVTVLERPMRVAALISALRSALRARARQYELRTVVEGLRESDQRKTEFLATLAHELRNPMAPLTTSLAILSRMHPEEEARPYYDLMGRQLDHMVRLVNDLMEVSRVTRAQIELRRETLSIAEVIAGAVELSKPLIDAAKHRLEVDIPEPASFIHGDRVRLTQVFSNLLNNAAKYTPEGGHIRVGIEPLETHVVVRVEDDGVGIPPQMLQSVFGMFVQVSGMARAAQGGLGIGLTLVKSLVELHGGTVEAQSAGEGRGTRVTVTLPRVAGNFAASAPADAPNAGPRVLQNLLIVDDNRDAADSMATLLELMGSRTTVAYDGESALLKAAEVLPSIAILDIGMPRMDGCELARRLREDPIHQGMALVALTGWGQQAERQRIASSGFDLHLLKPVDIDHLAAMLEKLSRRGG